MLHLLENRYLYNADAFSVSQSKASEIIFFVSHDGKNYDHCGLEVGQNNHSSSHNTVGYFSDEDFDWLEQKTDLEDLDSLAFHGNLTQFFISEAFDDFSLERSTEDLLLHSFKYSHLSNALGLLRWSAQNIFAPNYLNSFFLLEIGGLYVESYQHQQNELEPLRIIHTSIDSVYDEHAIERSQEAYLLNQATLAIVGLEAMGVLAYQALGFSLYSWPLLTIPMMQIGMGSIQIYQGINALDQYASRAQLALPLAEVLVEYDSHDKELVEIGGFIQDAQDVYEGMFLVSCDLMKFMGNVFSLAFGVMNLVSQSTANNVIPKYTQYTANGLLVSGGLAYAGYGFWQIVESLYEKKSTFEARFDAMSSMIQGNSHKAENHLLEMDGEFVVKRLLDRLDSEKNDFYQPVAFYLEKLGIHPEYINWLRESENNNPKARSFLAHALGIELRT